MSPDKYKRIVRDVALQSLAELEGRLRATAEEKLATAASLKKQLENAEIPPKMREQGEGQVEKSLAQAKAAAAEADIIEATAKRILGIGESKKESSEKKPHRMTVEDVILTLQKKVMIYQLPQEAAAEASNAIRALTEAMQKQLAIGSRTAILEEVRARLLSPPWPSTDGVDATVMLCVRALGEILKRDYHLIGK